MIQIGSKEDEEIYVALSNVGSSSKLHLTATTGSMDGSSPIFTYTYDKTGIQFKNGYYYEINVKMDKAPIDLSDINDPYTAVNGDILTGTLVSKEKITIASGATVTLKDATINFIKDSGNTLSDYKYAGLTCEGDATIKLEGTNNGGDKVVQN